MNESCYIFVRSKFYGFNEAVRDFSEKYRFFFPFYKNVFLPLETMLYRAGNSRLVPGFKEELEKALDRYLPEEERRNPELCDKLSKDILKAHFLDRMNPEEYFLYGFRDKNYTERRQWLSDRSMVILLNKKIGRSVFHDLINKDTFYELTKEYFHREVLVVNEQMHFDDFLAFAQRQKRYILKPLKGAYGRHTFISSATTNEEVSKLLEQLLSRGSWMAEELIIQHPATAVWNPSSVNTVRVPSFLTTDGVRILQPFFRTGRKGSVVDNAGLGGIFAVFDQDTGVIISDGVDEHGGRFPQHPDSGVTFKGWQVPQWDDLKELVAKIHHSLPSCHRYVGFDFALTEKGWVLIEGNWGQMVGQMAELRGIRYEFISYLG